MSQTQISNLSALVGLIVLLANHFGIVLSTDNLTFFLGAGWSILSVAYNYYQRYQKGDLNLLGGRIK